MVAVAVVALLVFLIAGAAVKQDRLKAESNCSSTSTWTFPARSTLTP